MYKELAAWLFIFLWSILDPNFGYFRQGVGRRTPDETDIKVWYFLLFIGLIGIFYRHWWRNRDPWK